MLACFFDSPLPSFSSPSSRTLRVVGRTGTIVENAVTQMVVKSTRVEVQNF